MVPKIEKDIRSVVSEETLRHRAPAAGVRSEDEPISLKPPSPSAQPSQSEVKQRNIKRAFIPDDEINQTFIFKVASAIFLTYGRIMHNVQVVGVENVPKNKGAMIVSTHTTHNVDIFVALFAIYAATGKMVRGLFHRTMMIFIPAIRFLGGIPGHRDAAQQLIKAGFLTSCLPGGAEEAMTGHENAYTLCWQSSSGTTRAGFARVALEAENTCIIPLAGQNQEEMRFNPLFYVWHELGLPAVWHKLLKTLLPYKLLHKIVFNIGAAQWLTFAILSVPIPVPYTIHILEPVYVDAKKDKAEDVAEKVRLSLQSKYEELQGGRERNIERALAQRGLTLRMVAVAYIAIYSILVESVVMFPVAWPLTVLILLALHFPFSATLVIAPLMPLFAIFA